MQRILIAGSLLGGRDTDIIFSLQNMAACTQRRSIPMTDIPDPMENRLQKCGTFRVLEAVVVSGHRCF